MKTLLYILAILISGSLYGQERHWTAPDHVVLQYAGSIGQISGGVGYNIFRSKARTSLHFGYVPETSGGPLHILSGKLIFIPKSYRLSERMTINPFDAGLMISYHFGERFLSKWPEHQYPEKYYWWKTSLRLHLNLESSVTLRLKEYNTFKAISGYLEMNANELYLVSIFQNRRALGVGDVVMLGAGARLHF